MPSYAIWWLLKAGDEERFQNKIDELASTFGAPAFVPHITVASRIEDLNFCHSFCREISTTVPVLSSQTLSVHHDKVWNRALYLRVAEDPSMKDVHRRCLESLQRRGEKFYPHLSLLYVEPNDYDPGCLAAVEDRMLGKFCIDRIAVVDTEGAIPEWHCVEAYPLV